MMNYSKGGKEAQTAWFAYKEAAKNTTTIGPTRPAKSVVDFVAGFNAAKGSMMQTYLPKKEVKPMKASKIVLEQLRHESTKYKVKKLVNRVVPEVGAILKRDEVTKLQTESENLTIEITEAKR